MDLGPCHINPPIASCVASEGGKIPTRPYDDTRFRSSNLNISTQEYQEDPRDSKVCYFVVLPQVSCASRTVQQTLPGLLSSSKIYVLSAWKDRPEACSLFNPTTGTFEKARGLTFGGHQTKRLQPDKSKGSSLKSSVDGINYYKHL